MEYEFKGKHYLASYRECREYANDDLVDIVKMAIIQAGATILDFTSHTFLSGGITFAFILSESHCTVHTYPEHNSMFIDLFTCGDSCDNDLFHKTMIEHLQPLKVSAEQIMRN